MQISEISKLLVVLLSFLLLLSTAHSLNTSISYIDASFLKNLHLRKVTYITDIIEKGPDKGKLYSYKTIEECKGINCFYDKRFKKLIPKAKEIYQKYTKEIPLKDFWVKSSPKKLMNYPPAYNSCYDLDEAKWYETPNFILHPTNDDNLSEEFLLNSTKEAMKTWELYNEYIFGDLSVDYTTITKDEAKDNGKNELFFDNTSNIAHGMIISIYIGYFKIIEADVVFNKYSTFGDYSKNDTVVDFQGIATHELGHTVGLDDLYNQDCKNATMYGGSSPYNDLFNKRTLEAGDKYGIYLIYPMNCLQNSDCGLEENIGQAFCNGNTVYQKVKKPFCENAATPASKCSSNTEDKLMKECSANEICPNGKCIVPECSKNEDCGTDSFIETPFCNGNFIYQKYKTFTCNNAGMANASCSSTTENKSIEQCGNSNKLCNLGECISPLCSANSDCGSDAFIENPFCIDNSVYQKKQTFSCNNPGTLNANCSQSLFDELLQACEQNKKCSNGQCLIYINIEAMKAWQEYQKKKMEIMMQGPYIDVNLLKGIKDYANVPKQDNGSNQQPQQSNNASNSQQGQQSTDSKMTALTVLPAVTSPVNKNIQQVNYPEPKPVSKIRLRR